MSHFVQARKQGVNHFIWSTGVLDTCDWDCNCMKLLHIYGFGSQFVILLLS